MIIFPAIDLKDGNCVRLYQGKIERAEIFSRNPVEQAEKFSEQGFKWLHIVDLNGAFAGKAINHTIVEEICKKTDLSVQLGGGIRNMASIHGWINLGVKKIILGTMALKDPELMKHACKEFPEKIIIGIDVLDGMVAVEGWAEISDMKAEDMAKRACDAGAAGIIYTDISKDGAMKGPNIKATSDLAKEIEIPVILSGGISSINDVKKIAKHKTISGMIIGRAIYDKKITAEELHELNLL